jgi:hypothetical protein
VSTDGSVETGGKVSPRFDTNPILDVLAKESIAIARRKD